MSTRSLIKFVGCGEDVTIYKHWDGYPSGTLRELEEFFKWDGVNSRESYTPLNFVTFHKVKAALHYQNSKSNLEGYGDEPKPESEIFNIERELKDPDLNSHLHLGFGISKNYEPSDLINQELFWIEWYYIVNFDTMTIKVYSVGKTKLYPCGTSKIITAKGQYGENTKFVRLEHNKTLVKEIEK